MGNLEEWGIGRVKGEWAVGLLYRYIIVIGALSARVLLVDFMSDFVSTCRTQTAALYVFLFVSPFPFAQKAWSGERKNPSSCKPNPYVLDNQRVR